MQAKLTHDIHVEYIPPVISISLPNPITSVLLFLNALQTHDFGRPVQVRLRKTRKLTDKKTVWQQTTSPDDANHYSWQNCENARHPENLEDILIHQEE